jgi:hypothetical protein
LLVRMEDACFEATPVARRPAAALCSGTGRRCQTFESGRCVTVRSYLTAVFSHNEMR